jgi:AhpD family alkylhydroperoxidase
MPSRKLRRQLKETIAVAVSMTNGCDYCIRAHTRVLKNMFKVSDADIVEIAAATAHVNGLVTFEKAMLIDRDGVKGLFQPKEVEAESLLREVQDMLGSVPLYYRVLANHPDYLKIIWEREKATMLEGKLDRCAKEFIALAVSATRGAEYSIRFHTEQLTLLGVTKEELFEAIMVIEIFNKNNKFTEGLLLTPGVWQPKEEK